MSERRLATPPDLEDLRARTLAELEVRYSDREMPEEDYRARCDLVSRATNVAELRALVPAEAALEDVELEPLAPSEERGVVFAMMSAATRKGAWDPPETLYAVGFMGGVSLDFSEAELLEGVTTVYALGFMGGVTITVPPGLDVDANGIGFMGGFSAFSQRADESGGPLLRVRGVGFMGSVDVKVKRLKKK